MTNALQSALHLAPLPAKAWETTDEMFMAVDGYLGPATRLVPMPYLDRPGTGALLNHEPAFYMPNRKYWVTFIAPEIKCSSCAVQI